MAIDWTRKQGDTAPALQTILRDEPAPGQRLGLAVNISGADTVYGIVRRAFDRGLVNEELAFINDASAGDVSIILTPTISDQPGLYEVEFVVTWPDRQTTYPHDPDQPHYGLMVQGDLQSTAVPVAPIPGGSGGVPAGSQEFTVTAFETISALQVVSQTINGAELYEPIPGPGVFGVTKTAATAGNPITVQTDGLLDVTGASLTPGAWYYAGPAGTLTATQPTSGLLVAIGYAVDADTFIIQVGDPTELA